MNILDMLLNDQNSGLVTQLANKVGIDEATAKSLVAQLAPAVSNGIKNNVSSAQGLDSFVNALNKGNHQRYLDEPERLSAPEAVDEGNAILGHVFGGKEMSREVAGQAAQQSGVDVSIVKQLLPIIATMAMGALSKQTTGASASLGNQQGGNSMQDMVFSMLDANKDGNVTDDLFNLAKKFFR